MDIIIGLGSALIAGLLVWLIASQRANTTIGALRVQLGQAEARLDAAQASQAAASALETRMREAFAALSHEALTTNTSDVLQQIERTLQSRQELAQSELSGLLNPLSATLEQYRQQLDKIESERHQAYGSLEAHLQQVSSGNERLSQETTRLIAALRQPHVRGRWGEVQLRRVVELAGMSAHCDFTEQLSVEHENQRRRPDLIVHLPNQRRIIVDAKAPLAAYLEAHEAAHEVQRAEKLRDHARQVRDHVGMLASKEYQKALDGAHDVVILFIPGEVFYSAALQHDEDLLEYAFSKNIILANPSTLIALLKSVALSWREQRLAANARTITTIGTELYERLAKVTRSLNDVGKHLDKTINSYNTAIGSLETRVLVSARRLHELDIGSAELSELPAIDAHARQIVHPDLLTDEDTAHDV